MSSHYRVEKLEAAPIIITHVLDGYSIARDMPLSTADVRALLDEAQEPTFYILDISRLKLSLNDVIVGANTGARGETPLWHHPMIKELVTVSADGLVQLAAKGLSSLTFGNLHIRVFSTLGEAVEYCRVNAVAG